MYVYKNIALSLSVEVDVINDLGVGFANSELYCIAKSTQHNFESTHIISSTFEQWNFLFCCRKKELRNDFNVDRWSLGYFVNVIQFLLKITLQVNLKLSK